ncbi:unnamed protein product [Ophioblennius macclurei]
MLDSIIVNKEHHVGLQKLWELAQISRFSLGPCKSFKFVHDDSTGESVFAPSCYGILENLELSCPVAQLVYETLRAHQKVYHSGSGCLLFLVGAWSRVALRCLNDGIPVTHIVSAMAEGMDLCRDICNRSTISMKTVFAGQYASEASQVQRKTLNQSACRRLKHSRHFSETNPGSVSSVAPSLEPKLPELKHVAEGLSHGCDDSMKLVLEAARMQSEGKQEDVLDVTEMATCLLPGIPEQQSCVLPGCVVLLPAQRALLAHRLKERNLQVALVTGDLSEDFRHLGFSRPTGIQRVKDGLKRSREDKWMENVVSLLMSLDVNLILIGGFACQKVIDRCWKHQILVVENVKTSILKAFADLTSAVAVTYATQLSQQCIGSRVKVTIWRDLSGHQGEPSAAVSVCPGGGGGLVTAILTSCVHGKLAALEERFWACAYRVHYALKDQVLLPGAGRVEMLCIHHLLGHAELYLRNRDSDSRYRGVVLRLMADGLMEYLSVVMVNTGRFSEVNAQTLVSQRVQNCDGRLGSRLPLEGEPQIYDNLSVKQEAWRKALDVVLLILQTDAEIITGGGRRADMTEEHVTLL